MEDDMQLEHPFLFLVLMTMGLISLKSVPVFAEESDPSDTLVATSDLFPPARFREPQWELKTDRTLRTQEQIDRARKACEENPDAARIRDEILEKAEYWVSKTDEELREILPGSEVSRAFNVSAVGCPVHGEAIYKHGTYPWILDRDRPFVVKCPIGGEEYPSNDFAAFRRSGMKDRSLLTGDYADDGRGWMGHNGVKYWFVGYACHWMWSKHWRPAVVSLSHSYLLTGDPKYARKALVMLDRIAECYPDFEYCSQSRYGELKGGKYHGKILNSIWETGTLDSLAIAYDGVSEALLGDDAVNLNHRDAKAIRANIEANLLEEGLDSVENGRIRGNWGMHQRASLLAALVRQKGPTDEVIRKILEYPGIRQNAWQAGVNYALYNLIFADGMPFETGPGYCFTWVSNLCIIADTLHLASVNLFENPKVLRTLDAHLDLICLGQFMPSVGDSGSIHAGWSGMNAVPFLRAYRATRNPRYAWAATQIDSSIFSADYRSFDDLFLEPIAAEGIRDASNHRENLPSRLLDPYGMAILNNERNTVGLSLYYGLKAGHGHFDRLAFEMYAHGSRVSPDLGYPDFMNDFVPGIYSWSKNTIAHNTVVVNRKTQRNNIPGRVLRFCNGSRVRLTDIDASQTYAETTRYRRTVLQVDVDEENSYFVDVFRVAGGSAHDLSVHGPSNEFEMSAMPLSPVQEKGTLAGEDVPYGYLYDVPALAAPDYKGGFGGYKGSGYQHFFNVQKGAPGLSGVAQWKVPKSDDAYLRVRIMPDENQRLVVADAYVSPTQKVPDVLKYVLAQREGEGLESVFVTIWEPFKSKSLIQDATRFALQADTPIESGSACAPVGLRVTLTDGRTHQLFIAEDAGQHIRSDGDVETDCFAAIVESESGENKVLFAMGGTHVRIGDRTAEVPQSVKGIVAAVDYENRTATVAFEPSPEADMLTNRYARVSSDKHSCMRRISSVRSKAATHEIGFADYDLLVGRVKVERFDEENKSFNSETGLPWGDLLVGLSAVSERGEHLGRLKARQDALFHLDGEVTSEHLKDSDDTGAVELYFGEVGAGDFVEIAGTLQE